MIKLSNLAVFSLSAFAAFSVTQSYCSAAKKSHTYKRIIFHNSSDHQDIQIYELPPDKALEPSQDNRLSLAINNLSQVIPSHQHYIPELIDLNSESSLIIEVKKQPTIRLSKLAFKNFKQGDYQLHLQLLLSPNQTHFYEQQIETLGRQAFQQHYGLQKHPLPGVFELTEDSKTKLLRGDRVYLFGSSQSLGKTQLYYALTTKNASHRAVLFNNEFYLKADENYTIRWPDETVEPSHTQ